MTQLLVRVPDASFAIARDVQRLAVGALHFGTTVSGVVLDVVVSTPPIARPLARIDAGVDALARRGAEQRHADSKRFGVVLRRGQPLLQDFLEQVVEILPIDALLARVDLNALIARVDLNAVLASIEMDQLVAKVLAGIEIGDLIHDSTTSIASDLRDTVRGGAISGDGRLARVVDRIVRHGRERDLVLPGYAIPGVP